MSIVLDYTARIAPAALKAAGVSGVCRYVSLPQQNTAWKRIGKAEYNELTAAGIDVTLNFEYDARDWLGGADAGAHHGAVAVAAARALGYPSGSVIPGSADFDMNRVQWSAAGSAYARGFAKAVRAGGYRPGVYGPYDVLTWVRDEHIMDAFWQAGMSTAWSGGRNRNAWPGAHLRQRGHKTVGGQDTDWNDILIPRWGSPIVHPSPRVAGDDDMALTTDERRVLDNVERMLSQLALGQTLIGHGQAGENVPYVNTLYAAASAPVTVDAVALAAALTGNQAFIGAVATAVADELNDPAAMKAAAKDGYIAGSKVIAAAIEQIP